MALTDKRAQLYLTSEQFRKIMKLAKEKHTTFAQLTREAIDDYLRKSQARWNEDPITKHIGILEGKEPDLSVNHDQYIYEDQK